MIYGHPTIEEKLLELVKKTEPTYFRVDAIQYLIEQGAEFQSQNSNRETLLHIAVEAKSVHAIKTLLNNNIDKTLKNNKGETAYDLAVKNNDLNKEIIKQLKI